MYVKHTGQALEVIAQAVERDKFMSPAEAKQFGLIDDVMSSRPARDDENKTRT
jgi:ATP-dependent Clp protease protease subunit